MTDNDIPALIGRLRSKATDCHVSEEALYVEAAEALSLSVSPFPEEIAELAYWCTKEADFQLLAGAEEAAVKLRQIAAAIERMAQRNSMLEARSHRIGVEVTEAFSENQHLNARIHALEYERDRFQALWRQADDRAHELQKRIRALNPAGDGTPSTSAQDNP